MVYLSVQNQWKSPGSTQSSHRIEEQGVRAPKMWRTAHDSSVSA